MVGLCRWCPRWLRAVCIVYLWLETSHLLAAGWPRWLLNCSAWGDLISSWWKTKCLCWCVRVVRLLNGRYRVQAISAVKLCTALSATVNLHDLKPSPGFRAVRLSRAVRGTFCCFTNRRTPLLCLLSLSVCFLEELGHNSSLFSKLNHGGSFADEHWVYLWGKTYVVYTGFPQRL